MNSKEKGKRGEREFARMLKDHGFTNCRRGQQYSGIEGRDVVGIDGLHIEVKLREQLNVFDAVAQAEQDAMSGEVPVVAWRKNRKPWVVVIKAPDFIDLLKRAGF